MGSSNGVNTDFERVRQADNPVAEAGNVLSERVGSAGEAIGRASETAIQTANSAVATAKEKGGQAVDQAANVAGNFRHAVETSARTQPVTTVLMAVAAGFLFGALWRTGGSSN